MRMLETERLLLKPVEESDLKELLDMQWDRDLMKYMNFKPLSYENQKDWFRTQDKNTISFVVFLKQPEKLELIGLATLNQINQLHQRASWGLKIKSNLQSKGVGFEASIILMHYGFSNLNLQKIHGDIVVDNIANRKMCQKIGAREEGILTRHYYQNGEFNDVVLVGILKEEFYKYNFDRLKELGLIYQ
jgi:[ribosomal protein S5]-alanine N-acetyltransferase